MEPLPSSGESFDDKLHARQRTQHIGRLDHEETIRFKKSFELKENSIEAGAMFQYSTRCNNIKLAVRISQRKFTNNLKCNR